MKYGLKEFGWYLAWDKDGRYPIDNSKPIEIIPKDGALDVWLTHRPIQQEDGSWVKYDLFPLGKVGGGYTRYAQKQQTLHFIFLDLGELKHNKSETDIRNIDLKYLRILHGDDTLCDYKPQDNQTKLLIVNNQTDLYFSTEPTYTDDADGNKLLQLEDNILSVKRKYYRDIDIELEFYLKRYDDNTIMSNMFFDLEFNSDTREFVFVYKPIIGEHVTLSVYMEDIYQLHKMKVSISEDGITFNFNGKIKEYNGFIYMQPEEFVYNNQGLDYRSYGTSFYDQECYNNWNTSDKGLRDKVYNEKYWDARLTGKIANYTDIYGTYYSYYYSHKTTNIPTDKLIIAGEEPVRISIKNIKEPFFIGLMLNALYRISVKKTVTKYNYKTGKLEDTITWFLI